MAKKFTQVMGCSRPVGPRGNPTCNGQFQEERPIRKYSEVHCRLAHLRTKWSAQRCSTSFIKRVHYLKKASVFNNLRLETPKLLHVTQPPQPVSNSNMSRTFLIATKVFISKGKKTKLCIPETAQMIYLRIHRYIYIYI